MGEMLNWKRKGGGGGGCGGGGRGGRWGGGWLCKGNSVVSLFWWNYIKIFYSIV